MLRSSLAVGLALTALVSTGPPAAATEHNPPVTTVSYDMVNGQINGGDWTGDVSFGSVSVVPKRNATHFGSMLYVSAERSSCDADGCTQERIFLSERDSAEPLEGRITVAPDMSAATMEPTKVSVMRSVVRLDAQGRYVDATWTSSEETVSATATATGAPERDVNRVREAGLRTFVFTAERPAAITVTVGSLTFTSVADSGHISSGSDRRVTTHSAG